MKKYKQIVFILIASFMLNVSCGFINFTDAISENENNSYLDGKLISPKGHPVVYLISKNKKHQVPNIDIFNSYGYKWSDVIEVEQSVEHSYEVADLVKTADDEKVYYLSSGIFWIRTAEIFLLAGYNSVEDDVVVINKNELDYFLNRKGNLELIQGIDQTIFRISPFGTKRALRSQEIFESYGYSWRDFSIAPNLINALPETSLVRGRNDYKVYKIENGTKRWIINQSAFTRNGFNYAQIEEITDLDLKLYPEGESIR